MKNIHRTKLPPPPNAESDCEHRTPHTGSSPRSTHAGNPSTAGTIVAVRDAPALTGPRLPR